MTTLSETLDFHAEPLRVVRLASAAVALIVVIDAISVGAPGLALLAVPFVVVALRFSHGTTWGSALVVAACALYTLVGVNYAISNGVDAPWGDLLFAYAGTPLAAIAGFLTLRQVVAAHRR